MPVSVASSAGGFAAEPAPRFQVSDGPNPGGSAIERALLVFLPDPDSTASPSQFITAGGGPAGTWLVEVFAGTPAGLVGPVFSQVVENAQQILWMALDPAVFPPEDSGSPGEARGYRVRIRDNSGAICDEWDFSTFDLASGTTPANVAAINDAVRRIAGLLGLRRRVSYQDYVLGTPLTTLVDLLDGAGAVLASYRRRLTVDAGGAVVAETMAALDDNVL